MWNGAGRGPRGSGHGEVYDMKFSTHSWNQAVSNFGFDRCTVTDQLLILQYMQHMLED